MEVFREPPRLFGSQKRRTRVPHPRYAQLLQVVRRRLNRFFLVRVMQVLKPAPLRLWWEFEWKLRLEEVVP